MQRKLLFNSSTRILSAYIEAGNIDYDGNDISIDYDGPVDNLIGTYLDQDGNIQNDPSIVVSQGLGDSEYI